MLFKASTKWVTGAHQQRETACAPQGGGEARRFARSLRPAQAPPLQAPLCCHTLAPPARLQTIRPRREPVKPVPSAHWRSNTHLPAETLAVTRVLRASLVRAGIGSQSKELLNAYCAGRAVSHRSGCGAGPEWPFPAIQPTPAAEPRSKHRQTFNNPCDCMTMVMPRSCISSRHCRSALRLPASVCPHMAPPSRLYQVPKSRASRQ
jgi:hypothetical protein